MAKVVQFPENEWSKQKETRKLLDTQNEKLINNISAVLSNAIGIRDIQPYTNEHKSVWETEGEILKQLRMARGLLVSHVAEGLGVSPGRVKRIEAGEPVRDALLLKKAYMLFVTHMSADAINQSWKAIGKTRGSAARQVVTKAE
ncbi:helix-turn-helix domain-containing protein (plasmid) [Alicyclobacillus curvatus]|nr:helix-turn-helix domain-containing protein [Alicyclobacillus curvatus]